jgi:hypothetical protein
LTAQFEVVRKLTTTSHVMQWGDLSFQGDAIGDFVGGRAKNMLKFHRLYRRMGLGHRERVVDSRYVKIQMLSSMYASEPSL